MSIVKILKFILLIFLFFLLYLLIGSVIPCLFNRDVSKKNIEEFSKISYENNKTGPDRATIIESPTDSLNTRMEIVRNSKESLKITTYKIVDSESTRAFLGEIVKAANRGVKVDFILDGKAYFYTKNAKVFLDAMNTHPNINCKVYNPVNLLKPWELQFLLHDKIIISDDEYLLLGGRNIDERHFAPKGFEGPITYDREVLVWKKKTNDNEINSAIDQSEDYFNTLWNYERTKDTNKDNQDDILDLLENSISGFKEDNPKFYKKTLGDFLNRTVETSKITLISNPIEVSKKEPYVAYQMANIALDSKKSVILQTPYATGNKDLLSTLTRISSSRDLSIQTNSSASTPNIAAFSNYLGHRKKFVETGAKIYELQSTDSIHGKSMVIDDKIAIVGSCNMDDRSFYLDTETMLVIDSPDLAKELSGYISNLHDESLTVDQNNKYKDSTTVKQLDVSIFKRITLKLVYIIMRPFQFLI